MNRFLVLLTFLCGCVVPVGANAATPHRSVPDFELKETPPVFDESAIDSIFAARGERVVGRRLITGFTPGGTRDNVESAIPKKLPGTRKYFIGTSDLERYGKTRRKVSQMNNWSVGVARANWVWAHGYDGEVLPMTIMNYRDRGVYVIVTEPIVTATIVPKPRRVEVPLQSLEHELRITALEEQARSRIFPDWCRVGAGWTGVRSQQIDAGLPFGTLSAGWKINERTSLGGYAAGGLNLGTPNDRTAHAGAELRLSRLFLRLGYRTAAIEIPGDGHTLARYEGPELGLGYRHSIFEAGLYGSRGKYADVNDRRWRDQSLVSLELSLGNPVR